MLCIHTVFSLVTVAPWDCDSLPTTVCMPELWGLLRPTAIYRAGALRLHHCTLVRHWHCNTPVLSSAAPHSVCLRVITWSKFVFCWDFIHFFCCHIFLFYLSWPVSICLLACSFISFYWQWDSSFSVNRCFTAKMTLLENCYKQQALLGTFVTVR